MEALLLPCFPRHKEPLTAFERRIRPEDSPADITLVCVLSAQSLALQGFLPPSLPG